MKTEEEELEFIIDEMKSVSIHSISPKLFQCALKLIAELSDKNHPEDELKLIYYLIESHSIGSKLEANISSHMHPKNDFLKKYTSVSSNPLEFNHEKIEDLLETIAEMPKEWTVVQITTNSTKESVCGFYEQTSPAFTKIYYTVFNCGQRDRKPFCISTPDDLKCDFEEKIISFKKNLKESLSMKVSSSLDKLSYYEKVNRLNKTIGDIVDQIENDILGVAGCLLVGKSKNRELEKRIYELVEEFLQQEQLQTTTKKISFLAQAAKASKDFQKKHMKNLLKTLYPKVALLRSWNNFWKKHDMMSMENEKRNPVILVIDQCLDSLPWEMVSYLKDQPISRMPSLDLLYTIFKTHKSSIVDGYKIIENFRNGTYILDPTLDKMNKRMKLFYDYWLPEWKGNHGKAPTAQEFAEAVWTSPIFAYSGHGNGLHYCSSNSIMENASNAVVLLLGCSSASIREDGPEVEMYDLNRRFFFIGCPCIVGALWVITDLDADFFTTKFVSNWLPNSEQTHWDFVIREKFADGEINIDEDNFRELVWEPDLLRAVNIGKTAMKQRFNAAAMISRGIPVKVLE